MSSTAKKTPAPKTPAEARRGRGAYLPVLPDGWSVVVEMHADNGHSAATVSQTDSGYAVEFTLRGETEPRRTDVATLTEGCRVVAKGAKMLADAAKAEKEAKAARAQALDVFGKRPAVTGQVAEPRVLGAQRDAN